MKTVYFIDDESDFLHFVSDRLKKALNPKFTKIKSFQSCQKLLESLSEEKPDLILSDFFLDDCDALEMREKIRSIYSDLPILLLTGWARDIKKEERGLFDQVVSKPFDFSFLVSEIKRLTHAEQ